VTGLAAACDGVADVRVLFVDDSDDDTPTVIRAVSDDASFPVHVVHRIPEQRQGGLSGAVLEGIRQADSDVVVVMDADLQHRPHDVPKLIQRLTTDETVDLVVGSRYVPGGSNEGLDGAYRRFVSRGASTAARMTFPHKVGPVRDVSSGFYAFRRSAVDVDSVHPDGYKILLTTLVHRKMSVAEEPIVFAARQAGESKATFREGLRYIRLLTRLRMAATAAPTATPVAAEV
jgi:dolichol-phosphate mannosyltransferase